jgi:hypothetical protein
VDVKGDDVDELASGEGGDGELRCAIGEDADLGHDVDEKGYSMAKMN